MARTMQMNMPVVSGETSGGSFRRNPYIYATLPAGKAKGKAFNKIYVGLFVPGLWPLYTQEHPLLHQGSVSAEVGTFYWRFHGHYVPVRKSDGTHRTAFVLCAPAQNKFQVDELKYEPLFKDARCRYCEEVKAWWDRFDEEWLKTTYEGKALASRRDYNAEQFRSIISSTSTLRQIKDAANRWKSTPRYIFQVFDVSKAINERKMEKDEELSLQLYFAPKVIYDGLCDLYTSGVHFFDADSPSNIMVVKDTTGQFADYAVQNLGPLAISAETKAYVGDDANQVSVVASDVDTEDSGDDGAVRLVVLSYDEQRILSGLEASPGSGSSLDTEAQSFDTDKLEGQPASPMPAPIPSPIRVQAPIQPPAAPIQPPVQPVVGRPMAMPKIAAAVPVVAAAGPEEGTSGRRKPSRPW